MLPHNVVEFSLFQVDIFISKSLEESPRGKSIKMLVSANVQGENESVPSEHSAGSEDGKRSYTLFQGHAGPVYSATFSPLGDFILSSSSDSTSMFSYKYFIIFSFPLLSKLKLHFCSSIMEHQA